MVKIFIYFLAAIYFLSGAAKLAGLEFEITAFERWGYPLWFMYFTGLAEVAGGIAHAANLLRKLAAPALSALMIGAIATHIMHQEWPMTIIATVIFSLTVLLTVKLWKNDAEVQAQN